MNEWIEKFLNYLVADRGYSHLTIERYELALTDVATFVHNLDKELNWETIDADVIRRYEVERLAKTLTSRTMKVHLSALRSFYRYLLLMNLVERNPMQLIANPKCEKPLPTFLRESEMNKLFDEVKFGDDYVGVRDRLILLTFYHTGVRISELVGLDVSNVSLTEQQLKVLGKRNKERWIPFGKELQEEMQHYIEKRKEFYGQSDGALFLNLHKRRLNRRTVHSIVEEKLALVTTQQKRSPHVLRHTFATVMLNSGADIEAVKELLGHESLTTTEVYTHTTIAELKKQYESAHPRA